MKKKILVNFFSKSKKWPRRVPKIKKLTAITINKMQDYFDSPYYQSAMYDSECGQIHPLNYCLGLAKELLKNKNCKVYEESEV